MTTKLASEFDDTYTLVTNSQDIEEVISYTGTTIEPNEVGSMFVRYSEADIEEVYYSEYCVPYLTREYTKVY
jgi:hypothetical protein